MIILVFFISVPLPSAKKLQTTDIDNNNKISSDPMKYFAAVLIAFATTLVKAQQPEVDEGSCLARPSLTCYLVPTLNQNIEGEPSNVRGGLTMTPFFNAGACFTRVTGTITGLGTTAHGFHVHEFGDISQPDGSSIGGHYNPFNQEHASPNQGSRTTFHMGDMGNVFPNEEGVASFDTIYEDPMNTWGLLGRGVAIDAQEDLGRGSDQLGIPLATCVLGHMRV